MTLDIEEARRILTTQEVIRDHLESSVAAALNRFGRAVHPIYRADRKGRPTLFGTCIGLVLDGRKYLVTAAHVLDDIVQEGGYVISDGRFVPLLGDFFCTKALAAGRELDHLDFAWKSLRDDEVNGVDWGTYFVETDLCKNRAPSVGRVYLALGYPRSKNKKADPTRRKVRPKINKYYSTGKAFPDLFASLGLSGQNHIAIGHANRSVDGNGAAVNSIYPRGMSGGPFIDLGRNSSPGALTRKTPFEGTLAGMLIERYDERDALLAVKIDLIVHAIRTTPPTATIVSLPNPDFPVGQ